MRDIAEHFKRLDINIVAHENFKSVYCTRRYACPRIKRFGSQTSALQFVNYAVRYQI